MRAQAKSVEAFAANPIRARILAREIERNIIKACPPPAGKYCRLQHVTCWIELNENPFLYKNGDADEVPSLRRPFSRWLNGSALPSSATRIRLDGLFKEKLGSKWCERGIDDPEQTLLVALDLISRFNTPSDHETLAEAEAILAMINAAVRDLIPKIPSLDQPKFSSYRGGKALGSLAQRKPSRYANLAGKRVVAYPYITEGINPYDTVSPLCAALMYLIKPNNKTVLPDDLAQALLLDFISGVIAAYIVMLHRNPTEFQTGGLVVDLYRLVYRLLLRPDKDGKENCTKLAREVFHNRFPDFPVQTDDLKASFARMTTLLNALMKRSGLSIEEFFDVVHPVGPDCTQDVIEWWVGNRSKASLL
jgi:hypothetical protein